jgi:hypothetical protein
MKPMAAKLVALFLVLGCSAMAASGQTTEDQIEPRDVFVLVSTHDGWGKSTTTALSCDGRYRIVGAYSDTTIIRGLASADSALSFINDLLAMNFFEQREEFKSSRTQLMRTEEGKLAELGEETMDAGSTRIELHVGARTHTVIMAYPAHGAPAQLHQWTRRFRLFMNKLRGW